MAPEAAAFPHEHFCIASDPYIETYESAQYDADYGRTVVRVVTVSRCRSCGGSTYDGVPERELTAR